MRRALLLLVPACAATAPRAAQDAPARQLDLDVVVGHGGVELFANSSDLDPTCRGGTLQFPQTGQVGGWDDIITCSDLQSPHSCLTHVELDVRNAPVALADANQLERLGGVVATIDVIGTGNAALLLEGCGGTASIPLDGAVPAAPAATATKDDTAKTVSVSWTATPDASTAVVELGGDLGSRLEHIVAHDFVYTAPASAPFQIFWVNVSAFAPVIPIATDYGVVRVWTGDEIQLVLP